jgi:methionyl-tRNA synthetase
MSPIFYGNADPHIGHLYTAVLCDATARTERQIFGKDTKLSIGTDEHGLKIQKRATALKVTPQELVDANSLRFKQLFDLADVKYDRFIRTTDSDHKKAVESIWKNLARPNGPLVSGKHEGYYSTNEETFFMEKDLEHKDGHFYTNAGEKCEKVQESNYVFNVRDDVRKKVHDWAKNAVLPEFMAKDMMNEVYQQNDTISVSRPSSRISWGIPVPGDDEQTVYVWLDALTNYLTVLGYPDRETAEMEEEI